MEALLFECFAVISAYTAFVSATKSATGTIVLGIARPALTYQSSQAGQSMQSVLSPRLGVG